MTHTEQSTPARILAMAEPLFAAHGFDGTSLRAIAAAAHIPVGGIAYHFGSKDGLYRAIWERRMHGVGVEHLLDRNGLPDASTRPEGLRRIITAFFAGPRAILQQEGGHHFIAIMVREAHDPRRADRGMIAHFVQPNAMKIHAALTDLCPHLSAERVHVGFLMTISALRLVIEDQPSPERRDISVLADFDRQLSIVTDFVVAGWLGMLNEVAGNERLSP